MRLTKNQYAEEWSRWDSFRFRLAARIIGRPYFDEFSHWYRAPGCPICKKPLNERTAVEIPQAPIEVGNGVGIPAVLLMCGSCAAERMIEEATS